MSSIDGSPAEESFIVSGNFGLAALILTTTHARGAEKYRIRWLIFYAHPLRTSRTLRAAEENFSVSRKIPGRRECSHWLG